MEQTYFGKIRRAAKSECMNRRKIRLIILILTIAAAMFEIGEYQVYGRDWDVELGVEINFRADFSGYFGVFLMFVAAAFGAFAVFGIFSDLTSRQTADVQLSLPMSAKDRYLSKLLALAEIHLLPIIASGVLVTFIGNLIHNSFDKIEYLLRYHMVVLAAALFVDAICVFCMCCCGAKAEGIYTSIITGICVSLTPYLFFTLGVMEFSRIDINSYSFTKFFSLLGFMNFMWNPDIADELSVAEPWLFLIGNCLVSSLLIFASFYIYRKRDGRQVGKPMVYGLFMELFMFIGLFTLFTIFFYTGSWGIGLTIAVIIYMIIRIVSARAKITPKLFAGWIGKYAVSLAVFTVIMGAAYFTGGFGYYKVRQTEIDRNTVNFDVEVRRYRIMDDRIYSTMVNEAEFDNIFYIDTGDRAFAANEIVYYTANSAAEVQEKLDALNRIIDEYYTLEDRTWSDFFDTMVEGSLSSRYSTAKEGTYVSVEIWNNNASTTNYEEPHSYGVRFWLSDSQYDELCSRFGEVLDQTGSYYVDEDLNYYGYSNDLYYNYGW